MKKQRKQFATPLGVRGLLLITLLTLSCKKEDRTTVVFGTVKNEINQPIEGIEMVLYGEKGILASNHTQLKSTKTDAKGEYTLTSEISKDYHSGSISFNPSSFPAMYDNGKVYLNTIEVWDCCPAVVGQKSQYDFVLERK